MSVHQGLQLSSLATAELYPTVTLGASASSAASTLSGLFNSNNVAYGVGPTSTAIPPLISWAFPNTLIAQAHIREARAQASGALASFDGTVLTALKEAETAPMVTPPPIGGVTPQVR